MQLLIFFPDKINMPLLIEQGLLDRANLHDQIGPGFKRRIGERNNHKGTQIVRNPIFYALMLTFFASLGCGGEYENEFVAPEYSEKTKKYHVVTRDADNHTDTHSFAGYCLDDRAFLSPDNTAFAETLWKCGKEEHARLFGSGPKTVDCLEQTFDNVDHECLNCFDRMTACGASNCKTACFWDSRSEKCQNCTFDTCGEAFKQCSGMDPRQTPKLKP